MADDKTLGQVYHEEVEELKAGGTSNADAIREVAQKHDKKENAVRGGIHQYRTKLNGTSGTVRTRRGRQPAPGVDDLVALARQHLEEALSLIDREVETAKTALDEAQSHYDDVAARVKDRKADVEKKLKALA